MPEIWNDTRTEQREVPRRNAQFRRGCPHLTQQTSEHGHGAHGLAVALRARCTLPLAITPACQSLAWLLRPTEPHPSEGLI
jgi:hypothetical protein